MKLPTPYRCDYCPNTKGESNHWWLLVIARVAKVSLTAYDHPEWEEVLMSAVFSAWNDDLASKDDVEHICSQECASKALSKWMSTITSGKQ